ncbi:hypothetical protein DVS28_b0497 (plasmid) [Euzebya pacifica]|uniref:Uncharacterized protein n=1 Tax=Euzebya pacifica TaxID=1608957 RepID=A0A346Y6Z0_9ACTN|nr:hypothetical protein [Euzebya pacifica]AXV10237.1 hypothetical protein DVS28_b0497 [Euzebya pacifica]
MEITEVVQEVRSTLAANPMVGWVLVSAVGALLLVHHKPRTRKLLPVSAVVRVFGCYLVWVGSVEVARSALPEEWVSTGAPWAALLFGGVAVWLILMPRREIVFVDPPPQVDG